MDESADEFIYSMLPKSDQWFRDVRNRIEYNSVVRLREQLRALPPPADPTDEELLRDTVEVPKLAQEPMGSQGWPAYCWLDWPFVASAVGSLFSLASSWVSRFRREPLSGAPTSLTPQNPACGKKQLCLAGPR
jgi:hypothetical protein